MSRAARDPPRSPSGDRAGADPSEARPIVAMTRPDDGDRFFRMLERGGFEPIRAPLTRVLPPVDPRPLDDAVRRLAGAKGRAPSYDVLLLTSARAVQPVVERLEALGMTAPFRLDGVEVWVVGKATGAAAERAGLNPDRVPERFVSEGLLEEAPGWMALEGAHVLLPRAARGREVLPRGLRGRGARVTVVPAYRTEADAGAASRLVHLVLDRCVDAIPLTAGSAAAALARAWRKASSGALPGASSDRPWPDDVPIVAIGPATRARAEALGLPVRATADPHTLGGVVDALRGVL